MPSEPFAPVNSGSRRRKSLEAGLVLVLSLAALLCLSRGLGLTWDEAITIKLSDAVTAWFRGGADFSREGLARTWGFDPFHNVHPAFFRVLDAIGAVFVRRWLDFPLEYRFAHLLYASFCLAIVYRLLRSRTGALEALAAIVFVTLLPRSLGDLLLANSDGPVMISWLAAVVVAWRLEGETAQRKVWLLRIALVALCAVGAAAKFTGMLMLPPLAAYFLLKRKPRELLIVGVASFCAVILPVLTSPEKWAQPVQAAVAYLTYPFARLDIPVATTYLGRVYVQDLPWHYFLVMSLVTVPLVIWPCLPGLFLCPPKWRSLAQALAVSVILWAIVGLSPNTPRHDGVRQFVAIYPLLALLAWIGFMGYLERLSRDHPRLWTRGRPVLVLSLPLLLTGILLQTHPRELSFYNSVVGGIRGAESLGMEITYYFEALNRPSLQALEENVLPGQTVAMSPYMPDLLQGYRDHSSLRLDFRTVKAGEPADWLLLYRRRHTVDDKVYLALPAVHEVQYSGVSLLKLVRQSDVPKELGYAKPSGVQ